uniref:Polyprotein n=1 Tax=Diuris pendunculata cryptic virus TaxID=1198146 RepID=M1FFU5_9VIRU|nr:polyprotein [Diuris pendunculata cryptic virus]
MEYLIADFSRITHFFRDTTNLTYSGTYHFHPRHPEVNLNAYEAHQRVLRSLMDTHLFPHEIQLITDELRRSDMTIEAILADFFANDVEYHEIPFDSHIEYGIKCMLDAFRPPKRCRPVHLLDVQHHYPYKWQVNAEPPFSTDTYFLDNLPTYRDFWNERTSSFDKYVDPEELNRRLRHRNIENLLDTKTPAKFGFLKNTVFSWTRRWHHIIKDGFTDTTGLTSDAYLRDRFIFPMLLHTKTAIVKKLDPNKMRTIWGVSKPWIIAETMLYWEYIAYVKQNTGATPMLWGYETFTGGWLRLNAALYTSHVRFSFLTLDWKRFDKKAYFPLIYKILLGVRDFLDFDNGYAPTVDYPDTKSTWTPHKSQRLQNLWLWTIENLFNAPIVLPDGRMYKRRFAGIPSGLFITQLLDSWYNYTMLASLLSALSMNPKSCIIKVQGDDSIIRLGTLIPPSQHEAFLLKLHALADFYFKASLSLDKSEVRNSLDGCEILSYRHIRGIPYRDEITMLSQFYHTKARNPTPEIAMAQAAGFAYASCGHHRRVYNYLESVYNHYAVQGYTPNRAGLSLVFGNSPDLILPHFELDHFPTISEIQHYYTSSVYRNESQMSKIWPLDHFLYPPAET